MLAKCERLEARLRDACGNPEKTDILREYRMWFDSRQVASEGTDGWPLPHCFLDSNVSAFARWWSRNK